MNEIILITISSLSISILSAYIGTLMLQRKAVLTAGPLGHLAIPGVALALLFGFNISVGAFPFVILGALIIWYLEKRTFLSTESLTAIIFATGVALGFLLLPMEEAEEALIGNITNIGLSETVIVVIISTFLIILIRKIFKKMVLITISEDLAKIEKINVSLFKLIYLLLISLVVSLGVRLVGGLLTAALIAIPVSSAKNITSNLKSFIFTSILISALSTIIAIGIFKLTSLPLGPVIILVNAFIFIISVFFKK